MKIYLLSNEKIKIHINRADMEQMKIHYTDLDYTQDRTKAIVAAALNRANIETGFDSNDSKLLIETYPAFDKGVTIYITKLTQKEICHSEAKWFLFESFEKLLAFASKCTDNLPCSVYHYNNRYLLSVNTAHNEFFAHDLYFISEYAQELEYNTELWRITENANEIIHKNAIQILKKYVV